MTFCRLPVDQRRGYTGVVNALSRIIKEEGVVTLWRVRRLFLFPWLLYKLSNNVPVHVKYVLILIELNIKCDNGTTD